MSSTSVSLERYGAYFSNIDHIAYIPMEGTNGETVSAAAVRATWNDRYPDAICNAELFNMSTYEPASGVVANGEVQLMVENFGVAFVGNLKPVLSYKNNVNAPDWLGVYPLLVRNSVQAFETTPVGLEGNRARTCLAWNDEQVSICFVRAANGCTLEALAEALIEAGFHTAINLDGGGSTAVVTPYISYDQGRKVRGKIGLWVKGGNGNILASSLDEEDPDGETDSDTEDNTDDVKPEWTVHQTSFSLTVEVTNTNGYPYYSYGLRDSYGDIIEKATPYTTATYYTYSNLLPNTTYGIVISWSSDGEAQSKWDGEFYTTLSNDDSVIVVTPGNKPTTKNSTKHFAMRVRRKVFEFHHWVGSLAIKLWSKIKEKLVITNSSVRGAARKTVKVQEANAIFDEDVSTYVEKAETVSSEFNLIDTAVLTTAKNEPFGAELAISDTLENSVGKAETLSINLAVDGKMTPASEKNQAIKAAAILKAMPILGTEKYLDGISVAMAMSSSVSGTVAVSQKLYDIDDYDLASLDNTELVDIDYVEI